MFPQRPGWSLSLRRLSGHDIDFNQLLAANKNQVKFFPYRMLGQDAVHGIDASRGLPWPMPMMAVFTPTTLPLESPSGPPEFPRVEGCPCAGWTISHPSVPTHS